MTDNRISMKSLKPVGVESACFETCVLRVNIHCEGCEPKHRIEGFCSFFHLCYSAAKCLERLKVLSQLFKQKLQDDTLSRDQVSLDIATSKNLQTLVEVAERRLKMRMSRVNLETCQFEEVKERGQMKFGVEYAPTLPLALQQITLFQNSSKNPSKIYNALLESVGTENVAFPTLHQRDDYSSFVSAILLFDEIGLIYPSRSLHDHLTATD
ncbi:hypothetical protein OROGR_009367 [Orobanche gracilis]